MKEGDTELLKLISNFERTFDLSRLGAENGWCWRDVRVNPAILNRLFLEGYLDCKLKTNSYTGYLLSDKGWLVVRGEADLSEEETLTAGAAEIPGDIFDVIEGHDDIKDLVKRALDSEKPVHLLFAGVPASAKTMFLMELSRLGAPYVLGSQATKAGIAEVLFDTQPGILLVDEIDRIGTKDIAVLLSIMETGVVSETKYSRRRELKLDTKVFAASNTINMPRELLSRFMVLYFQPYDEVDFLRVACNVVVKREGIESGLAEYIALKVWHLSRRQFADPREAVRIARLAKSKDDVDKVLGVIGRYSAPIPRG